MQTILQLSCNYQRRGSHEAVPHEYKWLSEENTAFIILSNSSSMRIAGVTYTYVKQQFEKDDGFSEERMKVH